ncbi:MAG: autotransporter domain-containing protein, partial [Pseudomonadota bacterium]
LENPGAFGYTNVTDPCLGNPSCTGFDEYLFWDGFHPTETGHQLVAALVAASLGNASDALAASALGETGIWMRQRGSRMAFNRLNNLRNISGEGDEIAGVYASGERVQADLDGSGDRSQYDYNLTSYRLGFDKKIKRGLIAGIAAGFTNSETEGELVDFDGQAVQFDAYAGLDTFNFFANLGVGFGTGSYEDYERRIPGLPLKNTSETIDAIQYSAGAEVGYRFGFDGIQIVPMAGLDFIHSSVDGFTESSDVGTGFNVGDQDVDALVGSLDLMLQKAWGNEGGTSYTSYFRAGYEDFLSYSGAEYDVALQGSGAGGTIDPDDPDAAGTNFGLGFAAGFANSAYLGFDYGLDLRNGEGTAHSGQLRLGYFLN